MTYEMVNVLIEKSEADLKALWGQMAEVHKQRSNLKEGTTFDEEKSVRWNREELDRRKRSLLKSETAAGEKICYIPLLYLAINPHERFVKSWR